MHAHIRTHVHTHPHAAHTHTHARTHIHTHTHTHTTTTNQTIDYTCLMDTSITLVKLSREISLCSDDDDKVESSEL